MSTPTVFQGAPLMTLTPLAAQRLKLAKFAYTTRHVRPESLTHVLTGPLRPRPGDLVLATVAEIGQHARIELIDGRRSMLFCGDEVVVSYGARYAPDQFEAEVPGDLGPCDLVAAGGLAGRTRSSHDKMRVPTRLEVVGLLADGEGQRANLADWRLPALQVPPKGSCPPVVAVVGTCMNAGKTTSAAGLVRGLVASGWRVGAAKVTGTGAGGDMWLLGDAGASPVFDFTTAGLPSTYQAGAREIERVFTTLVAHVAAADVDVVVLEVADGLAQSETAELVGSSAFAAMVDAVVFAAGEPSGAVAGVSWLRARQLPVVAVTGLLTCSPAAIRQAGASTGLPVFDLVALGDPQRARELARRRPKMAELVPAGDVAGEVVPALAR